MATEKTDVVIVGVGAAGGILAAELSKSGMKVIGLERGPRLKTADFTPHDELRYFQRQDLRPSPKRQPITWRPDANTRAIPLPILNYGNQAGGGTVHYGALSWRFHEDDFRVRSRTIERYGASAIPQDSSVVDWPLSYADLEPFYDRAEYELGVSGKAGNLQGNKIDGGNVFEAPRHREYPLPALLPDQSGVLFEQGAKKLGYHPFSSPRAITSQPYHDRPGCSYCGFCQSFGCHIGAKSSILVTKLPEADATGNFKLLTSVMCYRVNSDNSGRVTGVSLLRPRRLGQHHRSRAGDSRSVYLRQHAAAAALQNEQIPERPGQFQRPSRQAHHGAHHAARFCGVRRSLRERLHGAERAEAQPGRFQRRQFRSQQTGIHSRRADFGGRRGPRGRPHRHGDGYESAAGNSALGCGVSRFSGEVFHALCGGCGADRESSLRRSDHRPRSPTCAISGDCPRRGLLTTGADRTKWRAFNTCTASSRKSATPWAPRTCGADRWEMACPARITKAARAWAAIRKIQW